MKINGKEVGLYARISGSNFPQLAFSDVMPETTTELVFDEEKGCASFTSTRCPFVLIKRSTYLVELNGETYKSVATDDYGGIWIGDEQFLATGVWSGRCPFAILVTNQRGLEMYIDTEETAVTWRIYECLDDGRTFRIEGGEVVEVEIN